MKFLITSGYGVVESVRDHPHNGIDLAMPMDTPLKSFCDGIVEKVVHYGKNDIGNGVIVKAENGREYIYGHLDKVNVHQGQAIARGDLLGLSGSSGHSTGPHLHFGEMVKGHFVDPSNVIEKVSAMAGGAIPNGMLSGIGNHIKDQAQDAVEQWLIGAVAATGAVLLHGLYAFALVGGGILIVLRQLGFHHRWLKPSVLVGTYMMIRFLFEDEE